MEAGCVRGKYFGSTPTYPTETLLRRWNTERIKGRANDEAMEGFKRLQCEVRRINNRFGGSCKSAFRAMSACSLRAVPRDGQVDQRPC